MRFSKDDGSFGFVVTPIGGSGMYRFQVIVQGELVGDEEASFLESAMKTFGRLRRLDDGKLDPLSVDPSSVMATLLSEDSLHDAVLLEAAESLDGWLVRGYVYEGCATILARRHGTETHVAGGRILASTMASVEYDSIFNAAYSYWAKTRSESKNGPLST